jgi:hypothetical protein
MKLPTLAHFALFAPGIAALQILTLGTWESYVRMWRVSIELSHFTHRFRGGAGARFARVRVAPLHESAGDCYTLGKQKDRARTLRYVVKPEKFP